MDDTPNKAIEAVVRALGGSKAVAPMIWPEKGVEEARRLLCDCLNDERPAKLDFAQVLFILRIARRRGIHAGMEFIAADLGYSVPTPIEPKDEADELRRQLLEMGRQLQDGLAKLERIERPVAVRAA